MNKSQLTEFIKQQALTIGFTKAGVAPAKKLEHSDYLAQWLQAGYHGTMHWMENHTDKRRDSPGRGPSGSCRSGGSPAG